MATHFSILAQKMPWMAEPGGLQSLGVAKSDMTEQVYICIPENPCFLCVHGVL